MKPVFASASLQAYSKHQEIALNVPFYVPQSPHFGVWTP